MRSENWEIQPGRENKRNTRQVNFLSRKPCTAWKHTLQYTISARLNVLAIICTEGDDCMEMKPAASFFYIYVYIFLNVIANVTSALNS